MYKIILATRYLLKRRITYLAVTAVALCVFVVVVVMTVMAGLVRDYKLNNHNWVGDCVVSSESLVGFPFYEEFMQILEKADFVQAVSPVIKTYGILTVEKSGRNKAVEILGIDPVRHCQVTGFGDTLYRSKNDVSKVFKPSYDPNLPGVVLGVEMVSARNEFGKYEHRDANIVFPCSVSCFPLTAKGALAKAGLGLVNSKTFYYSDNSHSGLAKVDDSFVYLLFEDAQMLCGMAGDRKRVSAIHVKFVPDIKVEQGSEEVSSLWQKFAAEKSGQKGADLLSNVMVESWKGHQRGAIAPMETEQTMMMVAFGMLGIINVFIVLVVFYMIIGHKSKDIGILKSIGVANRDIVELFLGFAFLVGVCGSAIGTGGGIVFLAKINQIERWLYNHYGFQLWNRMMYAIDDIPNKIEFEAIAVIVVSAIAACLVGALIPSWQAARLEPVETLQVSQL